VGPRQRPYQPHSAATLATENVALVDLFLRNLALFQAGKPLINTPAVDRDLVAERPQTVSRPDEIDLCWCARPLLLGLPESVGGGSP